MLANEFNPVVHDASDVLPRSNCWCIAFRRLSTDFVHACVAKAWTPASDHSLISFAGSGSPSGMNFIEIEFTQ